jgi:hypothetical protein
METSVEKNEKQGIIYRTVCQNPGCGHAFDLRITPKNAGLLGGTMPCPRCHRRGGMIKPIGKIRDKTFAAKLVFRAMGVNYNGGAGADEGDLVSEIGASSY